jgi:hypothetical protein
MTPTHISNPKTNEECIGRERERERESPKGEGGAGTKLEGLQRK